MRTEELDFHLPPELIAQVPAEQRTASRLLHYQRAGGRVAHRTFSDLPGLLRAGDLLVFNDARVIPARFTLRKNTGGRIEALFIEECEQGRWRVLLKNLGTYSAGLQLVDAPEVTAQVLGHVGGGEYELQVDAKVPALALLERIGRMPLPPYIKREKDHDARDDFDRERYQTVYARASGSVAAPTAGLHFTPEILAELQSRGIEKTFITLHVGLGTFKPVTTDTLEGHEMHEEAYTISTEAADAINRAKSEGRRIIAVGTTSARVLEAQPANLPMAAKTSRTAIFIYPPYQWRHVGALVTNFHLPRSTLIALVAAMMGLEEQRRLYALAIENRYRFFSYGDAMFIE